MSSGGQPTYRTVVQKDGRGLFVIYKGLGNEVMARAPIVRGKVQTILKEGDEIRGVLNWLETRQIIRVRGDAITHETSLRKYRRQDDFGSYARSAYEQWRVVRNIADEKAALEAKKEKAEFILAAAKAKKLLTEDELKILGITETLAEWEMECKENNHAG